MELTRENVADVLREKLLNGEVNFVFKKVDGSRRVAVGTTNIDLVPRDLWPKDMTSVEESTEKQKDSGVVRFFDLEKGAWRSCKVDNILEVDGEEVGDE
jgi:hypothetical protein